MIIKKFQGKTEAEAVESAKKELGSNVVIMNVRNIKRKGMFSFLKPQLVEVTVALEEEPDQPAASPKDEARPQPFIDAIVHKAAMETAASIDNNLAKDTVAESSRTDSSAIEEKLDTLHTLLEQQLQKPEELKGENPEEEQESEVERFMKLLYNTMLTNEVNEQNANQIIDEIEKINKPNMPFDYALANIYQKMILKFGKPIEITPASKGPKVIFFVGPTGVGKTTTIAKIASKFSVEGGRKIALLTADTYRIAAAEQLRTYANILEVPFRVIYSTEEIEQALKDFRNYDFIMVDTAGHSHQNEAQKEAMNSFIHCVDGMAEKEVFLVLSATTKYRDLASIADVYSEMTEYKLIFTKLDETTTLGSLLNLKLHTGASLSYVTYGQNVPDDIEVFNPQKTVKQLLGGKGN
ncbi:MAG: flagellar biosynthesis protein FlhF [Lachnospiraceae bacterium]|nr:flagellar biosynthesis protein FlhF [Lachnospiraceae bacterium]MDE6183972.1 flagellar biosynthesis protein FlhF [Lachnospiraceae bacterium]